MPILEPRNGSLSTLRKTAGGKISTRGPTRQSKTTSPKPAIPSFLRENEGDAIKQLARFSAGLTDKPPELRADNLDTIMQKARLSAGIDEQPHSRAIVAKERSLLKAAKPPLRLGEGLAEISKALRKLGDSQAKGNIEVAIRSHEKHRLLDLFSVSRLVHPFREIDGKKMAEFRAELLKDSCKAADIYELLLKLLRY